jgi:hypothetical protein
MPVEPGGANMLGLHLNRRQQKHQQVLLQAGIACSLYKPPVSFTRKVSGVSATFTCAPEGEVTETLWRA